MCHSAGEPPSHGMCVIVEVQGTEMQLAFDGI